MLPDAEDDYLCWHAVVPVSGAAMTAQWRLSRRLRQLVLLFATALFAGDARVALAQTAVPTPRTLWRSWSWEPSVLFGLVLAAGLYTIGLRTLRARYRAGQRFGRWRVAAFLGGLVTLFVALVSPLDALGSALFHAGALWLWHAPPAYEAAIYNDLIHILQHGTFFGTALLFWWFIVHPLQRKRMDAGAAVLYLFTTMLQAVGLGALLTFSPRAWYSPYEMTVEPWGLTPLQDQQLGGVIMWIPMGVVYVLSATALLALWLSEMERRAGEDGTPPRPAVADFSVGEAGTRGG